MRRPFAAKLFEVGYLLLAVFNTYNIPREALMWAEKGEVAMASVFFLLSYTNSAMLLAYYLKTWRFYNGNPTKSLAMACVAPWDVIRDYIRYRRRIALLRSFADTVDPLDYTEKPRGAAATFIEILYFKNIGLEQANIAGHNLALIKLGGWL